MEGKTNISQKDLEKMKVEEVVDLKVTVEDLILMLDNIIKSAENVLNAE